MPRVNGNRDMKTAPKGGATYCGGCDRYLLSDGEDCVCGWKNPIRYRRKGSKRNRVPLEEE